MDLITLLLLAVGLSMDAFAVSICKGLSMKTASFNNCLIAGIWFGGFQGLMPFIGYILGVQFETYIDSFSSWIAFILLGFIGGNMIREAIWGEEDDNDSDMSPKAMLLLAIATSIDALAVGITFACVPVQLTAVLTPLINTIIGCFTIAIVTCILSMLGVRIGNIFGLRFKKKAEITGGVILILLGTKILLEFLLS